MVCGIWFFGVACLERLIIVCVKKSAVVFLTRAILFCGAAQFSQWMFMVKAVLLLMAERNFEQQTSLEMRWRQFANTSACHYRSALRGNTRAEYIRIR